jgi:hypothetical protein
MCHGWTQKGVWSRVLGSGPGPDLRPKGPNLSDPSRNPPLEITHCQWLYHNATVHMKVKNDMMAVQHNNINPDGGVPPD